MKICILGTARSGTKAIYVLLQNILKCQQFKNVTFVYEPFLWDIDVFNDYFINVQNRFKYIDSLSKEGIYRHQSIPLFVQKDQEFDESYLRRIFGINEEDGVKLVKMIKGNGRYHLMKKYAGTCKFIFVIRNPIDSVNSLRGHFSFFGGEFHKDDYGRFVKEVYDIFNDRLQEDGSNTFYSEVNWWYYMNRYALESFQDYPEQPQVICYENFVNDSKKTIKDICKFLDIQYNKQYLNFTKNRM